ncbi:ACP phosphodiesterase [Ferrimonas senticii]|uniref:acyl carrier protein phosphodiesterase n=1 Tax=Ferrimonas senticii TaxID=394566 RepID=UPI0003F5B9A2|nr:ACP phosphodiesterase [Ferrimonas senticii]
MNFLCHFYVADKTNTDFAGAIAADFVRGSLAHWPEPLRTGMQLHRQVDGWVDHHPLTLALKQQFASEHRRVAGILLDMAFDHCLAKQFQRWHPLSLSQFSEKCYRSLQDSEHLPEKLQHLSPRIAAENWLMQYRQPANINLALTRIALRLKQPQRLVNAIDEIWRLQGQISTSFDQLLPDIVERGQRWVANKPVT